MIAHFRDADSNLFDQWVDSCVCVYIQYTECRNDICLEIGYLLFDHHVRSVTSSLSVSVSQISCILLLSVRSWGLHLTDIVSALMMNSPMKSMFLNGALWSVRIFMYENAGQCKYCLRVLIDLFDFYIWTASMQTLARSTWPCFITSVANSTRSWR